MKPSLPIWASQYYNYRCYFASHFCCRSRIFQHASHKAQNIHNDHILLPHHQEEPLSVSGARPCQILRSNGGGIGICLRAGRRTMGAPHQGTQARPPPAQDGTHAHECEK